jgi:hypothetical protein
VAGNNNGGPSPKFFERADLFLPPGSIRHGDGDVERRYIPMKPDAHLLGNPNGIPL